MVNIPKKELKKTGAAISGTRLSPRSKVKLGTRFPSKQQLRKYLAYLK
jgi:hypothetical protein